MSYIQAQQARSPDTLYFGRKHRLAKALLPLCGVMSLGLASVPKANADVVEMTSTWGHKEIYLENLNESHAFSWNIGHHSKKKAGWDRFADKPLQEVRRVPATREEEEWVRDNIIPHVNKRKFYFFYNHCRDHSERIIDLSSTHLRKPIVNTLRVIPDFVIGLLEHSFPTAPLTLPLSAEVIYRLKKKKK